MAGVDGQGMLAEVAAAAAAVETPERGQGDGQPATPGTAAASDKEPPAAAKPSETGGEDTPSKADEPWTVDKERTIRTLLQRHR